VAGISGMAGLGEQNNQPGVRVHGCVTLGYKRLQIADTGHCPVCKYKGRVGIDYPGHVNNSMYAKLFCCLLLIVSGVAQAQTTTTDGSTTDDDCKSASSDCVAVGKWNFSVALGAGIRSNPLATGQNIPLVVIPQFSYYGKRFFINDLDLGFTVAENQANTVSLVASPGYDRVFFYRSDLQNIFIGGLPGNPGPSAFVVRGAADTSQTPVQIPPRARHFTYLAGPEWTFKLSSVSGQLDVLHDITDQNNGTEIRAALGIPLVQSKGSLTANIGVTWKSAAIVNYYYGSPGIYETGSALNPFIKLGYTLPLAGKWRFSAFAEYERLGNAIANSPIVEERYVETAFVGAIYTF
jgi:outer membrane protein